MGQPYIGEIRMFAGNYAPNGWMFCNGQLLAISDNDALFNLIGTTYGGDGQVSFGLPDLRGRIPIHTNSTYPMGQPGGSESVTLTSSTIPSHTHAMMASTTVPAGTNPQGNVTGQAAAKLYRLGNPTVAINPQSVVQTGGNQPHDNMQPYLSINFIISLFGIYPSQT